MLDVTLGALTMTGVVYVAILALGTITGPSSAGTVSGMGGAGSVRGPNVVGTIG